MNPQSALPRRIQSEISLLKLEGSSSNSMRGYCSWNVFSIPGSHFSDTLVNVATRTRPVSSPRRSAACCSSRCCRAHISSKYGVSARPSAVGVTPPWLRTSSVTPSSSSSEEMAWLTPDWVKFISRAAAVKLPFSTVFRNI